MPSDEELYQAFKDREDEGALRALVERHWAVTFRLAHAIVRDEAAAEDVAQEAFVRVVSAARKGTRLEPFTGWLRTVTVNESRMSLRSKKRRERREEAAPMRRPESPLDPAAAIREYAESLEERLREPLVLHYGLGLSHSEVGAALGCPAGTASSRIREGLEAIRAALSEKGTPIAIEAIPASLAVLGARPVPPAPRTDVLLAKATKAVGAAAGKKLAATLLVFFLCAGGMGAFVVSRMAGDEKEPTRSAAIGGHASLRMDEAPGGAAITASRSVAVASGDATPPPIATVRDVPRDDKPDEKVGPRLVDAAPSVQGPPLSVAATKTHAHVSGRVVDQAGRPVEGARVAVLAGSARTTYKKGVRIRASGPMPAQPPSGRITFNEMDANLERAFAVSKTLRGVTELAATKSAADGTFSLDVERDPQNRLFVSATAVIGGQTCSADKPLPKDDVGDLVVQRLPVLLVSVTAGGAPVPGASIHFVDAGGDETVVPADESGRARHATGAPSVLVTVSQPNCATARASVALATDQKLDLVLTPSAKILGTVRGPGHAPVAGVPVVALDTEGVELPIAEAPPLARAVTDDAGRFELDGLSPGKTYALEATPADLTVQKGEIEATAPVATADFELGRAGSLTAKIDCSLPAGDPKLKDWPGVHVIRVDGADHGDPERSVDGQSVTFARLAPGTYKVVSMPLLFPAAESDPVTIPPEGGSFQVPLVLSAGRNVKGRVVDSTGAPVRRARVIREQKGALMAMIAGESGCFELTGVDVGPFTFTLSAKGFQDRSVTADPGRDDLGDIVLLPAPPDSPAPQSPETSAQGKGSSGR